ncbi:carcinine hydrolase/isopenicillin-N N-acyltransferase family protein [Fundidesulfovibrio soli]|uniref:carcinine hydrolase/isopenicillin-N N-acyltransferase family protein n=1 Tax=Fundidesulfovibrio soli TaxID=2922716 RepID=UPI001FB0047C|nr:carcinine hydrolase/isopenicillin-N N-acyltransferase family protein [Fundidesulfovibrio soli]
MLSIHVQAACRRLRVCALLLTALALLQAPVRAEACTLWSAVGDVSGGGSLLAKNRDFEPGSWSRLVLVRPDRGLAYVGLYALVDGRQTLVAGVNEAGLAIVSATAGSVPKEQRKVPSRVKALAARLLSGSGSVGEALANRDWFVEHAPVIYMLADSTKSAWVEVAPEGAVAVREIAPTGRGESMRGGTLTHTNHFLAPELASANVSVGRSSSARLEGIQAMLARSKGHSLEEFERLGLDTSRGPDDSVFRTGSKPSSARTLAAFMTEIPAEGSPLLMVRSWGDPQRTWIMRLPLNRTFWERTPPGTSQLLASDPGFPDMPLPGAPGRQ